MVLFLQNLKHLNSHYKLLVVKSSVILLRLFFRRILVFLILYLYFVVRCISDKVLADNFDRSNFVDCPAGCNSSADCNCFAVLYRIGFVPCNNEIVQDSMNFDIDSFDIG